MKWEVAQLTDLASRCTSFSCVCLLPLFIQIPFVSNWASVRSIITIFDEHCGVVRLYWAKEIGCDVFWECS